MVIRVICVQAFIYLYEVAFLSCILKALKALQWILNLCSILSLSFPFPDALEYTEYIQVREAYKFIMKCFF